MIREILSNEIEEILEFTWRLSKTPSTNSYSLYNTYDEMKTRFLKAVEDETDKLYAVFLEESLCGVICFEVIPENKYIQTIGIYISSNFNNVMSEIFNKLRIEYVGYEIYLGYPKENELAIDYCKNENMLLMDSSIDFRLRSIEFTGFCEPSSIKRITETDFDEYAKYHDEQFKGFYWTSHRLIHSLEQWRIYVHQTNDSIDGCIFIKVWGSNCEIFGLANTSDDKALTTLLLSQSLSEVINKDDVKDIIFFVEDKDETQVNAAKKVGFLYHNSYCCFKETL